MTLPEITDQYMHEMLGTSKSYTVMLLYVTEEASKPGSRELIWEHGRRNFALRAENKLPIVCPATDEGSFAGIGIFDASSEEVERLLQEDPGVQAGLLTYELHPIRGFPGSSLP